MPTWLLSVLVIGGCLSPLIWDYLHFKRLRPFTPAFFFSAFNMLELGFLHLYIVSKDLLIPDFLKIGMTGAESAFQSASLMIALFGVTWTIGYSVAVRSTRIIAIPAGKPISPNIGIVLVVIMVAMFLVVVAGVNISQSRSEYTQGGSGLMIFGLVAALKVVAYSTLAIFAHRHGMRPPGVGKLWLAVGFFLLVSLLFWSVLQLDGRARALYIMIDTIAIWSIVKNKANIRLLALVAGVSVLLIVLTTNIGGVLRMADIFYDKNISRNFDSVENITLVIHHVSTGKMSHQFGAFIFADVFKDLGLFKGELDTRQYFMDAVFSRGNVSYGIPITRIGDFYLNFSWPGVVLYAFFVGYLAGKIYEILVGGRQLRPENVALYILLFRSLQLSQAGGYFWNKLVLLLAEASIAAVGVMVLFGFYKMAVRRRWWVAR